MNTQTCKRITLRHLRRPANDATFDAADLLQEINSGLRDVWREVDGSPLDITVLHLAAGQTDYRAPMRSIESVAVVTSEGSTPTDLQLTSERELAEEFPAYPHDTASFPWLYVVRSGGVSPAAPPWNGVPAEPALGGLTVRVYPASERAYPYGLRIRGVVSESPLVEDADECPYPDTVAEAACLKAAIRLSPHVADDGATLPNVPFLQALLKDAIDAARAEQVNAAGPLVIYPYDGFDE